MTMFDFMANAFYMFCGVVCIAASVLVVYIAIGAIFKLITGGKRTDGRKQGKQGNQDRS